MGLTKLKRLDLGRNQLKDASKVADVVTALPALKSLKLSSNALSATFKLDLGRNSHLKEVYLDSNRLHTIVIEGSEAARGSNPMSSRGNVALKHLYLQQN